MIKNKLLMLFTIFLYASVSFSQSKQLSAIDILQKNLETIASRPPMMADGEVIDRWDYSDLGIVEGKSVSRIYISNQQHDTTRDSWKLVGGEWAKSLEHRGIWDGSRYTMRERKVPHGNTNVSDFYIVYDDKPLSVEWCMGGAYGLSGSPGSKHFAELLLESETLSFHPEMEQVDGFECYVIEGDTPDGHYTVWIDPNNGYLHRKIIHELFETSKVVKGGSEVTDVKIESFDGIPVVTEATRHFFHELADGSTLDAVSHEKMSNVVWNPDFESMGAFKMDIIPDGTRVIYRVNDLDKTGVRFHWQDGKIVPFIFEPQSLLDKPLPELKDLKIELSPADANDKMILVCFFDIQQRPSRNCMKQLSEKVGELKEKDFVIIAIQASKVEKQKLDEWIKENNIPFPIGIIEGDEKKTCAAWGVKALPWLILTDKQHIVTAEGITLAELDEKIKSEPDKPKSFLDAQILVDGWEANYGHIDCYKAQCSWLLVDSKGPNPLPNIPTQSRSERIQDGRKFMVRFTRSLEGFNDTDDYVINAFDGSIGKEYMSDRSSRNRGSGTIYRGPRYGGRNLLGDFLESLPVLYRSEEEPQWKAKPTQQYPLGIPTFIDWYNRAVELDVVWVRPYLESVAGESCHVLELDYATHCMTFWFAHEKSMLLMRKKLLFREVPWLSKPERVRIDEVKEIASVTIEKGVLWYPRVIMDERIREADYSYTAKVTVHEFVPYFKAPAETFNYVFPNGTRVYDRIKYLRYTVGESKTATEKDPIELKGMYSGPVTDEITLLLQERDNESNGHDVITNSIGMELKLIEPGSFVMGSDSGEDNEKPAHKVILTKPFYIGVCEVTQQQYEKVMDVNPSGVKGPRRPVTTVSWDDAHEFCQRLSDMENRPYRLPTEAEWEYACRSGTTTKYYWADEPDGRYAWTDYNSSDIAHDVGTRLPNAWGLHDMSGNVSEWCADWYDATYPGWISQSDPKGPARGQSRVLRGGGWFDLPWLCRSADRYGGVPDLCGDDIGFRVVLDSN